MFAPLLRADVVVLVHGYLGSAKSWEQSGVTQALAADGWRYREVLAMGPAGVVPLARFSGDAAGDSMYTVQLPSTAPIRLQAGHLAAILDWLELRHPDEPFHLVGHSAGGVVARATLVEHGLPRIDTLVTLGAPHLGTARALEALDKTHESGPFGMVKDIFGGSLYHTVKDSWGVLRDLAPAYPGNYLFWLNQQSHPEFRCVSVIRAGAVGMGDELVPAYSQDMNQVAALSGRCERIVTPANHLLGAGDGTAIGQILAGGR
jgi:pimeloyl-ACP methyl ester carboxylesterase